MPGLEPTQLLSCYWQGELQDYVTAIAAIPTGHRLVLASAAGDVVLLQLASQQMQWLQSGTGQSIDGLAVSADGQFLALAGQEGRVQLWRLSDPPELIQVWEHPGIWIDRLAWSPTEPRLAVAVGRSAWIWDARTGTEMTRLDFQASSILSLDWHPQGTYLALAGYQGVKVWDARDWQVAPLELTNLSASVGVAWSPDGSYVAVGNLDSTLMVYEWGHPSPWLMRGFFGKIRQLVWIPTSTITEAPLRLAMSSGADIVLWDKAEEDAIGWHSSRLSGHGDLVQALAVHPTGQPLASASADGWVGIWWDTELGQTLAGVSAGFSCLAWVGDRLAAGGQAGEWQVWQVNQ